MKRNWTIDTCYNMMDEIKENERPYCLISFIWNVQKQQIYKQQVSVGWLGSKQELTAKRQTILEGVIEMFSNWIISDVVQPYKFTKNHIHLQWVDFMVCELYFNKTVLKNTAAAAAAAAKSHQSCPTLCDPIDGSPQGSPVPGILLARTLEWVAISFSNARKWKGKVKSLSRVWLFVTPWTAAHQAPPSMGLSRQEYWSGVPLPSPEWNTT